MRAPLVVLTVAGLAMLMPAPAAATHSRVELVSTGAGGANARASSFTAASDDGRRVFFTTIEALVPEDGDHCSPAFGCIDVYERDRQTGATQLVTTGPNAGGPFHAFLPTLRNGRPSISADGTHAFFVTGEPVIALDNDACPFDPDYQLLPGCDDVYERVGGVTKLVTMRTGAVPGSDFFPSLRGISPDGERAYFNTPESLADDDLDANGDVYVRTGDTTTLVTPGSDRFSSGIIGASDDGRVVIFSTRENLVPEDTDTCGSGSSLGPCQDLYKRDLQTGAIELVSTGPFGNQDYFGVGFSEVTPDGSRVYFETAEPLVAGDVERFCARGDGLGEFGCIDLYERNLETGTTTHLSTVAKGDSGLPLDVALEFAAPDGGHVYFSTVEQLVQADTDQQRDIYEWTPAEGTRLASIGPNGGNGNERRFEAFFRGASQDGDLFFTTAESLLPSDTDPAVDLYRHAGDELELLSIGPAGGNANVNALPARGATRDGERVFFRTTESLVAEDTDTSSDLYERFQGTTTLAIRAPGVESGGDLAYFSPVDFTPDGRHLFFVSFDALTADDTDTFLDIYAADLDEPPSCSAVATDRTRLWPPDHELRRVRLSGATDPEGSPVALKVTGVRQDEPVGGRHRWRKPDARLLAAGDTVKLRAERDSKGDGRVYRISFTASDGAHSCTGEVKVDVPRKKHRPAVDSAPPSFDSLSR